MNFRVTILTIRSFRFFQSHNVRDVSNEPGRCGFVLRLHSREVELSVSPAVAETLCSKHEDHLMSLLLTDSII
jgi:hypothetical protein